MKFVIVVLVVCVVAMVGGAASVEERSKSVAWRQFKSQFAKSYATKEEEARRFANFLSTLERIERHNANSAATYKMGINKFADSTIEERSAKAPAEVAPQHQLATDKQDHGEFLAELLDSNEPVPDEVDWRNVPNRVSSVKQQGGCKSGYAFATVGLLEGQQVVRNITKQLVELSAQNLVDCSSYNYGCSNGIPAWSLYEMAHLYGGIQSEADYKYTGQRAKKCLMDKSKIVMKVKGSTRLPFGDEEALKKVVATYGPVSALIDQGDSMSTYMNGVYDADDCDIYHVNHSVLIVGYGTDPDKGDYWLVKNSWGADFGERGYIRMKRGRNLCGIGSYPLIATF